MSRKIRIFDTTLRDGEQSPGCSMNTPEKIQLAKQLDKLNVDVIEAGFAIASPDDFNAIKEIAAVVENARVCSLARATKGDIDAAYQAVKDAKYPMIHTFLASSDIHLKYKLKMSRETMLQKTDEAVRYAKQFVDEVEFSPEDASRTDKDFLVQVVETAIAAGATVINIPDTTGYAQPAEFGELIKYVIENAKGAKDVIISAHCHDDLGLGTATTLSAILNGASQAECTINGIGERAGNAGLEEVVMAIKTREEYYGAHTDVITEEIYRTSKLLSSIIGQNVPPNKSIVGINAFQHESGIHQHGVLANKQTYEIMSPAMIGIPEQQMVLGKHSGKHAFRDRTESLGFDLSDEDLQAAFVAFKNLADKKKIVSDRDIEALLSNQENKQIPVFKLDAFTANAGSNVSAMACVKLEKEDEEERFEEVAKGDGPIDAAFSAINKITNVDAQLISYAVNSISEGIDAQGEALIRVEYGGKQYTGRGISTNIIDASIMGYINAINKILLEDH